MVPLVIDYLALLQCIKKFESLHKRRQKFLSQEHNTNCKARSRFEFHLGHSNYLLMWLPLVINFLALLQRMKKKV